MRKSPRPKSTAPPKRPTAPQKPSGPETVVLLLLVIAAIGAVCWFAFFDTGREGDRGKPPAVVSLTAAAAVPVATPPPSASPIAVKGTTAVKAPLASPSPDEEQ